MKTFLSLLTVLLTLYGILGIVLYLFQGSMVFLSGMPGRALEATPTDIGLDFEEVHIGTADGERLHGWFVPAENARGTLLFFHGNAGNISHRLESLMIFNRLRLDVLIIDYRGYGQSSGKTTEQGTYNDAGAAWRYLVEEREIAAERIIIFGRSLGGAVAAWLGARTRPAGLIIESSFSSGEDMARRLYPVYPARLLARLKYPVTTHAAQFRSPALIIHSRDDEIIPVELGRKVHDAVPGRREWLEIRGDHNAGFWISQDRYIPALARFIDSLWAEN
jgi:pimeloyl-ACP methyl ester carboxylesterase